MKKLILLFLAFVLTISPVFAAEVEEIQVKYEAETALLRGLGIIDGDMELTKAVTRGEFAELLYRVLGNQITYGNDNVHFADVTHEDSCFQAVTYMAERKLMSGHSDGLFRPGGIISYNEAAAVLVRALGYDWMAQNKGGYPTGYALAADTLDITDGFRCDDAGSLRLDEVSRLIYNWLFLNVSDIEAVNEERVVYSSGNSRTILGIYMDIYYEEGIVSDNSVTSLNGSSKIRDNSIQVGDIVMDAAGANVVTADLLGYNVRAYYRTDNNVHSLIYIEEMENDVITVNAEDIASVTPLKLIYDADGKKLKTLNIASDASYIYNGSAVNSLTEQQLKEANGFIRLIDSDENGEYDVLIVRSYKYMLFMSCNVDGEILYGVFNENINLANKQVECIKNGEKITVNDLKAYDILTISEGTDSALIEVSTEAVVGEIESIEADASPKYIIKGNKYTLADEYLKENSKSGVALPKLGEEGTFYITTTRKIIYFEGTGSMQVGVALRLSTESGMVSNPKLKVYTSSDEFKIFEFADTFKFNGGNIKKEDIYSKSELFDGGVFKREVIQYDLNKDGKISAIEFPDAARPDSDALQSASEPRTYGYYTAGALAIFPRAELSGQDNRAFYVKPSVIMFKIPEDIDDEYFYSVYKNTIPGIHDSSIANCQVYFNNAKDKRHGVADIVVSTFKSSRLGDWGVRPCVVKKITQGMDEQGNYCDVLTVLSGDKEQTYYGLDDTKINGLEMGDIIQLTANEGYITRYRKVYSVKENISNVEFYNKHDAANTLDKLKDFYGIDSLDSVDSLSYYVNKDIITSAKAWSNRSDNTFNTALYTRTVTGTVVEKNGKYIVVKDDNGKEHNFAVEPNLTAYYKSEVYRVNRGNGRSESITRDNICVGDRIFVLSEAFAVLTAAVIE